MLWVGMYVWGENKKIENTLFYYIFGIPEFHRKFKQHLIYD